VSLKKLISHTVIIGSLLIATPVGAVTKHINSPVKTVKRISHVISNNKKWYEPLLSLPDQPIIMCILHNESRSTLEHPNLGDDNGNGTTVNNNTGEQSGIFQMNNGLKGVWDLYVMPVLHVLIWKASAYQQAEGFAIVVHKDGYLPWTHFDGC